MVHVQNRGRLFCNLEIFGLKYLTLNRLGFSEPGKTGGGGRIPPCNFPIWRPMTVKFGDVILCQKLCQGIIKHLLRSWTLRFYDVISYFRLCSGKKVENRNFFVFHPICLKFGIGGNFEILISKRRFKFTLESNLSKKFAIFYWFYPKL